MCGTYRPSWLKDSHPQLEDGGVTQHVCMSSWNGCGCESHLTRVKVVYKFVRPTQRAVQCAGRPFTRMHFNYKISVFNLKMIDRMELI